VDELLCQQTLLLAFPKAIMDVLVCLLQEGSCTAPRSGLAVKHFIDVGGQFQYLKKFHFFSSFMMLYLTVALAGVIDEDYRGNVGVVLFNHSDADFQG
jgi:dUTPase